VQELDRRSPVGQQLAEAFLQARGPLPFEELVELAGDGALRDVSAWIGHALEARFIEERTGGREGVRCYELRARGRRVLSAEKRHAGAHA
jgi:hypothetical protein